MPSRELECNLWDETGAETTATDIKLVESTAKLMYIKTDGTRKTVADRLKLTKSLVKKGCIQARGVAWVFGFGVGLAYRGLRNSTSSEYKFSGSRRTP